MNKHNIVYNAGNYDNREVLRVKNTVLSKIKYVVLKGYVTI